MMSSVQTAGRQLGLTLIEMLVAMVLGILVSGGIITVFVSTSASNKAQRQMAAIQEAGRFAMARLKSDISKANGMYCSSTGGGAQQTAGGAYLSATMRAPRVYANGGLTGLLSDVTTSWGVGGYPATPTQMYSLPAFLSMRGYDCTAGGTCTPQPPSAPAIPAAGTGEGSRVVGSSLLTVRYLDASMGWSIGTGGSTLVPNSDATIANITLSPLSGEPPTSQFNGPLAMLAGCNMTQIFNVGTTGLAPVAADNFAMPIAPTDAPALRLFDFDNAYKTVTYYLQVVDSGNGNTTGALIRRVNGVDHELVRGIERLDFRYGVMRNSGLTQFMTAAQVDAGSAMCAATVPLPPQAGNRTGCLWRAVKSIEISLLVDGREPLHSLSSTELAYSYGPDGAATPQLPSAHAVQPNAHQGFPQNLLRREFTALVSVRNYNP